MKNERMNGHAAINSTAYSTDDNLIYCEHALSTALQAVDNIIDKNFETPCIHALHALNLIEARAQAGVQSIERETGDMAVPPDTLNIDDSNSEVKYNMKSERTQIYLDADYRVYLDEQTLEYIIQSYSGDLLATIDEEGGIYSPLTTEEKMEFVNGYDFQLEDKPEEMSMHDWIHADSEYPAALDAELKCFFNPIVGRGLRRESLKGGINEKPTSRECKNRRCTEYKKRVYRHSLKDYLYCKECGGITVS